MDGKGEQKRSGKAPATAGNRDGRQARRTATNAKYSAAAAKTETQSNLAPGGAQDSGCAHVARTFLPAIVYPIVVPILDAVGLIRTATGRAARGWAVVGVHARIVVANQPAVVDVRVRNFVRKLARDDSSVAKLPDRCAVDVVAHAVRRPWPHPNGAATAAIEGHGRWRRSVSKAYLHGGEVQRPEPVHIFDQAVVEQVVVADYFESVDVAVLHVQRSDDGLVPLHVFGAVRWRAHVSTVQQRAC